MYSSSLQFESLSFLALNRIREGKLNDKDSLPLSSVSLVLCPYPGQWTLLTQRGIKGDQKGNGAEKEQTSVKHCQRQRGRVSEITSKFRDCLSLFPLDCMNIGSELALTSGLDWPSLSVPQEDPTGHYSRIVPFQFWLNLKMNAENCVFSEDVVLSLFLCLRFWYLCGWLVGWMQHPVDVHGNTGKIKKIYHLEAVKLYDSFWCEINYNENRQDKQTVLRISVHRAFSFLTLCLKLRFHFPTSFPPLFPPPPPLSSHLRLLQLLLPQSTGSQLLLLSKLSSLLVRYSFSFFLCSYSLLAFHRL